MPDIKKAPWTDEEVKSLNDFQKDGYWHPFTCGYCRDDLGTENPDRTLNDRLLIATNDGWKCETCTNTQDWAHKFMVNGTWRQLAEATRKNLQRSKVDTTSEN